MTDLFVAEHGAEGAPLVVFVHGSLDRSSAFLKVIKQLPDLRVLRYDRRGYGHSFGSVAEPTIAAQVRDLAGVIGDRRAVLFGHSIGGVIALAYAQANPARVAAVLAYEASMAWRPWWPSTTAGSAALLAPDLPPADAAERFMRGMVGDERWESLPARTKAQRRAEGVALVADLRSIRVTDAPYEPAALPMPVVAAHGTESRPHHVEAARALAAEAPEGELRVVDGAGHGVHLTHPVETAALVRLTLARAGLAPDDGPYPPGDALAP
jgi:pimeloyl-ACP methyl ester carboxylesterase